MRASYQRKNRPKDKGKKELPRYLKKVGFLGSKEKRTLSAHLFTQRIKKAFFLSFFFQSELVMQSRSYVKTVSSSSFVRAKVAGTPPTILRSSEDMKRRLTQLLFHRALCFLVVACSCSLVVIVIVIFSWLARSIFILPSPPSSPNIMQMEVCPNHS